MMAKLTAEQRIERVHVTLMRHKKFCLFSGLFMVGKITVDDKTPTARTDGLNVQYGREFIDRLTDKQLGFLILHENMHKAYRHLTTWEKLYKKNRSLANAACDYVINLQIQDYDPDEEVTSMPTDEDGELMGLLDERFRGMNTKQVFDILKDEQEKKGGGGNGAGGEGGFDEHDWDAAKDMTEEEKRELERDIDQAIRQGIVASKKAGVGAGDIDRELKELMTPKVNWREALREFVKTTCRAKDTSSWRRPNRRLIASDIYMPSLIGEKVGHLVVGVDTSGSVGRDELAEFLSEVKGIAEEVMPDRVDLLYWDTRIATHEEYSEANVSNIVSSTKPRGGGGTAPSCVTTFLKEKHIKPECVIMLTDGYVGSDWGNDWPSPVLWAIVGGNDAVAPVGKTIHIKE